MVMRYLILSIWFGLLVAPCASAQNYHAIQGSSYAGSLGVHNNPASIANTPFKWDFTLFGLQEKTSTNVVTVYNFSLLSPSGNSEYAFNSGDFSRYADLNVNLNLFNTRIALNRKSSIAFGANFRSYTNLQTGKFNFVDTIREAAHFFNLNENNTSLTERFTSSSWVELYGSYARTIYDDHAGRLNAGITLKVSRGVSGAYANLDGRFAKTIQGSQSIYTVTAANLIYGYSSNYDRWKNSNSTNQNLNEFVTTTQAGAALDIGVEYLVKPQDPGGFSDEDNYYDYDWKFAVSLLDVGGNQYKYGLQSRTVTGIKSNLTNLAIDQKFDSGIGSLKDFNDSLATVADVTGVAGKFTVVNPMRLVINVDRFITGAFFVNAEVSINMPSSLMKKYLHVKELNMMTVTPRWETKKLGFYLPVQYNNRSQFWIGGAVKVGPLLLGIHNWGNVFSKTKIQNGGGYIALIFRAPGSTENKGDKRLNCPPAIW
jgi:hypothetical protein